ncbi:Uncharacterized conserved protein UCP028291 [Thiorhodococcus drewsii AZ1]|uniref:Uncharacterized conserved protein UCP028291 n=1 Tax=Thiorhodococcus drewsii AZ1 TaxID=765913 RepID=G2E469_9GAMM|nr:DUF2218 domain-containing protein [Thiorhodococcus drewsii]EGV29796.1 Uncharacterized conserved protein UCP028291 [Thiorhodococcus drewsii AZ1]
MPSSSTSLQAAKAAGYFDSLCRHFARKVAVERDGDHARVRFPMGDCLMSLEGQQMHVQCIADDGQALETLKSIVAAHALRFAEWRNARLTWTHR